MTMLALKHLARMGSSIHFLVVVLALMSASASAQTPSSASSTVPQFSEAGDDAQSPNRYRSDGENLSGVSKHIEDDSQVVASSRELEPHRQSGGSYGVLNADQIISVLQEHPDALVEVKSLLANLAQQQGTSVLADSITDDMLYDKIDSSQSLRRNITLFLQSRGYVIEANLPDEAPVLSSLDKESIRQFRSVTGRPADSLRHSAEQTLQLSDEQTELPGAVVNSNTTTPRRQPNQIPDNSTKAMAQPQLLRKPAPYNLLSLRDLYTQVPEQSGQLTRFGSDMFVHRDGVVRNRVGPGAQDVPLDVSAGPDYIIGPGDSLAIIMWGGVSQSITRQIDREGRVALPESGVVQIGGLTLEHAEVVIAQALKAQYRNVQVAVTVSHMRMIRVYVVGDVQRPGAYDISSLSTSLTALYAAGGPTAVGSLRMLRHYRGKQLIGDIDLYDFLLHGVQREDRLQPGDTLLVPPAGSQVAVYGSVKRPAIYELKDADSLASVLEDAGGPTVAAELTQITVDRIEANRNRQTVSLNLPVKSSPDDARVAIAAFNVQDGDRVHVAPIVAYSQSLVYVEGHFVRPGRKAYHDGMRLNELLHSYQDLLPEPAEEGALIRLMPPDLHPETIQFSVADVLIGNSELVLQPFDTVRVYGRYEADPPKVTIGGEVLHPGIYALSAGMTAAQLVRMAGGFKRDALLASADLTSYQLSDRAKVVSERSSIRIGDAVLHDLRDADVTLKPGDVLTVHQISGWNDIGSSIRIEGEVAHPGSYGIQEGERLSSILRRTGGLRLTSYPAGAVLLREDVRSLEEKSRQELIRQIETSSAAARTRPDLATGDQAATLQLIAQQQDQVLARLKSQPATGRLVIHIDGDISNWENTSADIEVRAGDVLHIPKRPGFVLVSGQVYNPSAITFMPDMTAGWYLRRAGGATEVANRKDIFIIRANGSVVGRGSGSWLDHDVLSTHLDPGDVVVVPQKIIGASLFWRNLLTVGQITSSIAITAAVAGLL